MDQSHACCDGGQHKHRGEPFVGEVTPLKSKTWEGSFLKQILDGALGQRELQFYKDVFDTNRDCCDQVTIRLRGLIPQFFGTTDAKFGNKDMHYIVLEDLCTRFEKPRWIEVVVVPSAKEEAEKTKELGFYVRETNEIRESKRIKITERTVPGPHYDPAEIEKAFHSFLTINGTIDRMLVEGLIYRLGLIQTLADSQTRFRFRDVRILLIYDAAAHGLYALSHNQLGGRELGAMLDTTEVRLTQFCNVTRNSEQALDREFSGALASLVHVLGKMLPPSEK